jgi:hypothetical protein
VQANKPIADAEQKKDQASTTAWRSPVIELTKPSRPPVTVVAARCPVSYSPP